MRKSTAVSMVIILIALVGMMVAADMALKPMQQVVKVGKDLTATLAAREDIKDGSKVVAVARKPKKQNLAEEGWGLIVMLEPSDAVTTRPGRLTKLAYRAAAEGQRLYAQGVGKPLSWVEVQLKLAEGVEKRTLLRLDDQGHLGTPQPALPARFP